MARHEKSLRMTVVKKQTAHQGTAFMGSGVVFTSRCDAGTCVALRSSCIAGYPSVRTCFTSLLYSVTTKQNARVDSSSNSNLVSKCWQCSTGFPAEP